MTAVMLVASAGNDLHLVVAIFDLDASYRYRGRG